MVRETIRHPLGPVFDSRSRVLILGTMPSPASRAGDFYYLHPQNRFWPRSPPSSARSLRRTTVRGAPSPCGTASLSGTCLRAAASRAPEMRAIREPEGNDIAGLIKKAPIRAVFATGQTAGRLYHRLCEPAAGIPAVVLPSPSAANCAMRLGNAHRALSGDPSVSHRTVIQFGKGALRASPADRAMRPGPTAGRRRRAFCTSPDRNPGKDLSNRSGNDKRRPSVVGGGTLVDEHHRRAGIVEQPRRRIDDQAGAADQSQGRRRKGRALRRRPCRRRALPHKGQRRFNDSPQEQRGTRAGQAALPWYKIFRISCRNLRRVEPCSS